METNDDVADPPESRPLGLMERMSFLFHHLQAVSVLGYVGAASLIGIEMLALVVGFTTVFPIAIPFVVLILGGAYFMRERLRKLWAKVSDRARESA